jgi:leucyl aminopeptidase
LFTNNTELGKALRRVGEQVHEPVWRLPVSDYHKKLITPKWSDLTNSSGKSEAGASQAAAFLKCFVEEGTKWAHLDIGGVGIVGNEGTGFGTRLLIEYARSASAVQPVKTE